MAAHLCVWGDDGIQGLSNWMQHNIIVGEAAVLSQWIKYQRIAPATWWLNNRGTMADSNNDQGVHGQVAFGLQLIAPDFGGAAIVMSPFKAFLLS